MECECVACPCKQTVAPILPGFRVCGYCYVLHGAYPNPDAVIAERGMA